MSDKHKFLERNDLENMGAHAIVTITIQVKTGTWGHDCTVAQAVGQAAESAQDQVQQLIARSPEISIIDTKFVRVICEAEKRKS